MNAAKEAFKGSLLPFLLPISQLLKKKLDKCFLMWYWITH